MRDTLGVAFLTIQGFDVVVLLQGVNKGRTGSVLEAFQQEGLIEGWTSLLNLCRSNFELLFASHSYRLTCRLY